MADLIDRAPSIQVAHRDDGDAVDMGESLGVRHKQRAPTDDEGGVVRGLEGRGRVTHPLAFHVLVCRL